MRSDEERRWVEIGLSGAGKSENCYKRREKRIAKRRTGRVLHKLDNANESCTVRCTLRVIVLTGPAMLLGARPWRWTPFRCKGGAHC